MLVESQHRARRPVRALAGSNDSFALWAEQCLGYKLSDVTSGYEGRVEPNHRGGPESFGFICRIHVRFDISGADADERAGEILILANEPVTKLEYVHVLRPPSDSARRA